MPGSPTTPGRPGTRARAPVRVAFRDLKRVGTRNSTSFAAQWLACALPYHANRAAALQKLQQFDAAITEYQKASELEPENAYRANALGNTFFEQGNFDKAR
jgi:tetratricopeptide (TPR) repeat protein